MPSRAELFVKLIQLVLVGAAISGLFAARPSLTFVALAALGLTFLPRYFAQLVGFRLPPSFLAAIAVFIFATIFLGEVADFYERYWWWDIALHFGSAVSFGLFGFLCIFMLFEGDRYAAPPWALGLLSFCVAMSVGGVWEIFEFAMDSLFGLNMQKSGLLDTMGDLIVDFFGAALGGLAGFLYLKGQQLGGLDALIDEFMQYNRRLFRKARRRRSGKD